MNIFSNIAEQYSSIFLVTHLFAMVLGLGGATYSDILLMKFLKDWEISEKEAEVIETMAKVILVGIALAFLSGFMLFLQKPAELLQSDRFILKTLVFVILVVNGLVLHKFLLPKLLYFSFKKNIYLDRKKHINLRMASFICGAISVVSWYTIFFIAGFKDIPFSFTVLLSSYLVILLGAILGAIIVEKILWKQAHKKNL